MRRCLNRFVPIVALALLVQIFAPIAAFRAVAGIVSHPLAAAVLCSGSADHGLTAPDGAPAKGGCCAVCATAGIAVATAPPPTQFAILHRAGLQIVWTAWDAPAGPARIGSQAQARAPPTQS